MTNAFNTKLALPNRRFVSTMSFRFTSIFTSNARIVAVQNPSKMQLMFDEILKNFREKIRFLL